MKTLLAAAALLVASTQASEYCPSGYVLATNFRCYRLLPFRIPYDSANIRDQCAALEGGVWVTGEDANEMQAGTASFKKTTAWCWAFVDGLGGPREDRLYKFNVGEEVVPGKDGKDLKFRTRQTAIVWSKKEPKAYENNDPNRAFTALCKTPCTSTLDVKVVSPCSNVAGAKIVSNREEIGETDEMGRATVPACPGEADNIMAEIFGLLPKSREILPDGTLLIELQNGECPVCQDGDKDGVPDCDDNCPEKPNPQQTDLDDDKIGDACDDDIDGDEVPNNPDEDNCPLVPNTDQVDDNDDKIGDACQTDSDGDGIPDDQDACPDNANIGETDFTNFENCRYGSGTEAFKIPEWIISNGGKSISQSKNTDPASAIGEDVFDDLNFEGTLLVTDDEDDDDYIGFVWGYQNKKSFYTFSWKKRTQRPNNLGVTGQRGIQVKIVNCIHKTRCGEDTQLLRVALFKTGNSVDMVSLLHHDETPEWIEGVEYRWRLWHRPAIGLIRVQLRDLATGNLVADTGNLFDFTFSGGQAGVYVDSQPNTKWMDLEYRCEAGLPGFIWDTLTEEQQALVERAPEPQQP